MRQPFIIALILAVIGFGAYIGHGAAQQCPVPIEYRIWQLDERFNLTETEALAVLADAEAVWEEATGRELFTYNPEGEFPINFIFDERQARTIAEEALRESLNEKEESTDSIAEQHAALVAEYEELEAEYEAAVAEYEARVADFNNDVAQYNDEGGAPPREYAELTRTERSLEREARELSTRAATLEALARDINALSERGNRLIEQYNTGVKTYNHRFGEPGEFTQGDYQGSEINVYSFSSPEELHLVLVHEFGHALSIGHVEGEQSIMYYLLEDQSVPVTLTPEDIAAFAAVCGEDPGVAGWVERFRHQFTQFLSNLQ